MFTGSAIGVFHSFEIEFSVKYKCVPYEFISIIIELNILIPVIINRMSDHDNIPNFVKLYIFPRQ